MVDENQNVPPADDTPVETGAPDKDARMWAMICHLSALAAFTCVPFANLIAPLIIWLIKRESHPFVDRQGKEAVNFQITLAIAGVVLFMITLTGIGAVLSVPLSLVLMVVLVIFAIIAGIKANNGEDYRYPICIRLVK